MLEKSILVSKDLKNTEVEATKIIMTNLDFFHILDFYILRASLNPDLPIDFNSRKKSANQKSEDFCHSFRISNNYPRSLGKKSIG